MDNAKKAAGKTDGKENGDKADVGKESEEYDEESSERGRIRPGRGGEWLYTDMLHVRIY